MKTETHEILQSTMNISKVSQDATEKKKKKLLNLQTIQKEKKFLKIKIKIRDKII